MAAIITEEIKNQAKLYVKLTQDLKRNERKKDESTLADIIADNYDEFEPVIPKLVLDDLKTVEVKSKQFIILVTNQLT
jgi:hypothetical protein